LSQASRKQEEFGIIVEKVVHRGELKSLTQRIDFEITKPFEFEGQKINLRASIGYALFKEDGIELDVLIEKADKSIYEVKRERKGPGNVR
jgi:diguanylate cyclase (GGDEF)-like protein